MPGIMFQDVVCSRARSNSRWYTVPLSFLAHTFALAALIVAPLVATDLLPKPRTIMQFVTPYVPAVPAAPPPARAAAPSAAAPVAPGIPLVAPETIGTETGVVFEPANVATSSIDGIISSGIGTVVVDAPPTAPPPPAAAPVPIGGMIKPPARTKYVAPAYPEIARQARVQGVVTLEAIIGLDGRVAQARVLRSSQPLLDQAALDALRAWEYTPTLLNGQPTAVIMTVTVQFRLSP